jgi:hypothetical protein
MDVLLIDSSQYRVGALILLLSVTSCVGRPTDHGPSNWLTSNLHTVVILFLLLFCTAFYRYFSNIDNLDIFPLIWENGVKHHQANKQSINLDIFETSGTYLVSHRIRCCLTQTTWTQYYIFTARLSICLMIKTLMM